MHTSVTLIGSGVMGSTFARAWISCNLIAPKNLTMCDTDKKKLMRLKRELGVKVAFHPQSAIIGAKAVLLAVKPQQIQTVLAQITQEHATTQLVISIAAGVTIHAIEKIIGKQKPIVRAMPNLPLTVGLGMTAWCANTAVTPPQKQLAKRLLSTGAIALEISESKLNAVTAISGSGPGYVFAFADALIQAGRAIGLSAPQADQLVRATFSGAGTLLSSSRLTPSALTLRVASRDGTTEAAFEIFKQKKFAALVLHAVRAAHRRARQLSHS